MRSHAFSCRWFLQCIPSLEFLLHVRKSLKILKLLLQGTHQARFRARVTMMGSPEQNIKPRTHTYHALLPPGPCGGPGARRGAGFLDASQPRDHAHGVYAWRLLSVADCAIVQCSFNTNEMATFLAHGEALLGNEKSNQNNTKQECSRKQ